MVISKVDNTSNVPSANSKIETSNVPPPKSYTNTFCSISCLSKPNANEEELVH